MLWQEDKKAAPFSVPDTVADLSFKLISKQVPLDHAQQLSDEILRILPWIDDDPHAGVHMIHGATTGNGWNRPEDDCDDACIYLSKRSKMLIRVPKVRHADMDELIGKTIQLNGHDVTFGDYQVKPFSPLGTLFCRYVIVGNEETEDEFVSRVATEMKAMGINLTKALCGMGHTFNMTAGPVKTMSIMVADLDPEDAVTLQVEGIGEGRKAGFGLFLAHKGIKAVGDMSEMQHFDGT
ncbi:MAG: type I-MYXAN CRISPR-associated protein Cas6/Cmx6 [endosymbiont of Galathealinum brachiosum]|uniref:Type I-MYXAN CRISPR-associated protein Cas6/Cmx6 n=1 Tax=endosymbiont of Galathealinum brachiosum TaxID=2200906 RepID=A0A370D824_9GAMM|nr:MAG: type I-MYXAN CRISPR-associated protein Cas6/Cmx6 [endosymbiont of Galathealinum brachiosum]